MNRRPSPKATAGTSGSGGAHRGSVLAGLTPSSVGLKLGATEDGTNWGWIAFAGVCMAVSGVLLLIAQKTIPIRTAYAVWASIGIGIGIGIGAAGTFAIGIMLFGDSANLMRFFFVGLIIVGIIGLKLASGH